MQTGDLNNKDSIGNKRHRESKNRNKLFKSESLYKN